MKTTIDYLTLAKQRLGIDSDYAFAKWLGVQHSAMSHYRTQKRTIDDYAAVKIAGALGINPMEVIAAANMEREKDETRKAFWENFSRGIAATLLIGVNVAWLSLLEIDGYKNAEGGKDLSRIYIMRN